MKVTAYYVTQKPTIDKCFEVNPSAIGHHFLKIKDGTITRKKQEYILLKQWLK